MKLDTSALIALRESSGMSQGALARRTGLSQGHISEIERRTRKPRPETIQKLAEGLGVSLSALLSHHPYGSAVDYLRDELADALEDKERVEHRIQRLEDRIARALREQYLPEPEAT